MLFEGLWAKSYTNGGTRTLNLSLRRGAPYPLGHVGGTVILPQRHTFLRKTTARLDRWVLIENYFGMNQYY